VAVAVGSFKVFERCFLSGVRDKYQRSPMHPEWLLLQPGST
jgi:hypothetical protein